jgi:hypothetical protein
MLRTLRRRNARPHILKGEQGTLERRQNLGVLGWERHVKRAILSG